MPLFARFWQAFAQDDDDESSGDEVEDKSAGDLSYVGTAAYDVLRKHHNHHHHELWNVTKGKVVGNLHITPRNAFDRTTNDPTSLQQLHDEWFPKAIGEIISRTEEWCDILSLTPPEGLFLEEIEKALIHLCQKEQVLKRRITVRMMFGNVPGSNCNCHKVITQLAKKLPPNAHEKVKIWVGAWRKGTWATHTCSSRRV
jgi:hypothetical protein